MTVTNDANSDRREDTRGILLSLPQCDMERPDSGVNKTGRNGIGIGNKKKSMKTTAKRADLVLFELPQTKKGNLRKDLLEGRCKILANGQFASLVTPSTSLQLVTVGTSNALVVWKKDNTIDGNNDTNHAPSDRADTGEESPMKRRRIATAISSTVAPCRLIQPGGRGCSFLVGQPHDLDPKELSHFFAKQHVTTPSITHDNAATTVSVSTSELCNLFQVAPNQIWKAMLWIPSVVSKNEDTKSNGKEGKEKEETWQLVPEEEVLFGQRVLVETLCEDDDNFGNHYDDCDGKKLGDESTIVTMETMSVKVSRRLLPLLMETSSSITGNSGSDKEHRCLAIARKTVLLASSSSYSTKTKNKLNDFNRPFRPDASRIAFYALRDLFLKYPSYAWSDLSEKWSTRLPLGERYERITSTTEWIEDEKIDGHGRLVPNQLIFSSSAPALVGGGVIGDSNNSSSNNSSNDEKNLDNSKSKKNDFGNSKAVLSLVDPQAVLIWRGG